MLHEALEDAYNRLIAPAIEREIRNDLFEKAEDGAIRVFGKNLEQLLMQPPIAGQVVLGWDPAFRTGCKLAVVDPTGKVLDTTVIYPTAPQNRVDEAKAVLKKLISKYHITLISLGNGTASRESEQIIVQLLKEIPVPVQYIIVNEAGASVYSASKLATEEFPQFDVGQRSAASMARRLQDPLAELVKIDPKSIGVGQYQHDVAQSKLGRSLDATVEDCVNAVGVDVNTASVPLLTRVSGLTEGIAGNIVHYRDRNGRFASRADLRLVPRLGEKTFEQAAGFLRITGGDNPLDASAVHPESYPLVEKILDDLGVGIETVIGNRELLKKIKPEKYISEQFGLPTITDILKELEKPGRDPRPEFVSAHFKEGVEGISDLKSGMILEGVVTNVTAFGAFVDIGVHQDGLVHISELSEKYVSDPHQIVKSGQIVRVRVLDVDIKRQRIALSMVLDKGKGSDNAVLKAAGRKDKPFGKRQVTHESAGNAMAEAFAKLHGKL